MKYGKSFFLLYDIKSNYLLFSYAVEVPENTNLKECRNGGDCASVEAKISGRGSRGRSAAPCTPKLYTREFNCKRLCRTH